MPRKNFSDEQIAIALRQAETGTPVGDVAGTRADVPLWRFFDACTTGQPL